MKLPSNRKYLLIATACGLLMLEQALAQGTLYVSNLSQPPNGSLGVGSESWCASFFRTGTNSSGYLLNSVQLLMSPQVGTPSGWVVSVYQYNNRFPGNSLGVLTGSDPVSGGVFTYSSPGISLSSATFYFLVVTSSTLSSQGSFVWDIANTGGFDSSDGWSIGFGGSGLGYLRSTDGINWMGSGSLVASPLFAVKATAVPESATTTLGGLGLASLLFLRRRK